MLIAEYFQDFTKTINEFSKSGFITTSELKIDPRTEKIGLIKAIIQFIDDSRLFVTEYVDLRYKIEKLSYSFHYQDKNDNIIFRYDNAIHKSMLNFSNHKHFKGTILNSEVPELRNVLEEIISNCFNKYS
ncbi:MAG: hypothetical protein E3K32_09115 [wastewater metagenome]|nr:hypothetical protein [Candidatus Loosdrechtia aerotolerans]